MNPQELHAAFIRGQISALDYARGLRAMGLSTDDIKKSMAYAMQGGPANTKIDQIESGIGKWGIQPGQHSARAEEGPSYGQSLPTAPMPLRRVDVLGQNGGEPAYQVTPPAPAYSGRELGSTTASQMPQPSPAARAVATARQIAADRSAPQPSEQAAPQQTQEAPSGLVRLVRGDFREGADQRIMDAMRRQREESGIESGKAEGGAATGKGQNARDAALHKALEIIHMMLSRH